MEQLHQSVGLRPAVSRSSEVAERALDVLLAFAATEAAELGVTQIAAETGLDKSQVHRFLMALQKKGLVLRNEVTRRYSLGPRILDLSGATVRQPDAVLASAPYLARLRDASEETAGLAMRVGRYRVHVAQEESRHELRRRFEIGTPLPVEVGAFGKVLVAFGSLDGGDVTRRDGRASSRQSREFKRQLSHIVASGFAESHGERVPGIHSIAAPVRTPSGVMAIGVSGPVTRFTDARARDVLPLLLNAADELSSTLTS
ncbi:MAG: IclR family transcriptional regulator [Chloroflexota bacterium]